MGPNSCALEAARVCEVTRSVVRSSVCESYNPAVTGLQHRQQPRDSSDPRGTRAPGALYGSVLIGPGSLTASLGMQAGRGRAGAGGGSPQGIQASGRGHGWAGVAGGGQPVRGVRRREGNRHGTDPLPAAPV